MWLLDQVLRQSFELWHKKLRSCYKIIMDDLKTKYYAPMEMFCDNKSTISIAHNLVQHDRTKHIEID